MLDRDRVVEIDHGVDGSEGGFILLQALVERFVGLGGFLEGQVGGCFEGVALEGDGWVRLGVEGGGDGGEG